MHSLRRLGFSLVMPALVLPALVLPALPATAQQTTLLCYGDFTRGGTAVPGTLKVAIAGDMALLSDGPLREPRRGSAVQEANQYRITAAPIVIIIDRTTSRFNYLDRSADAAVGGRGKCRVDETAARIPLRNP